MFIPLGFIYHLGGVVENRNKRLCIATTVGPNILVLAFDNHLC